MAAIDPEDHLEDVMSTEVPETHADGALVETERRRSRVADLERKRALRVKALQLRMGGLSYSEIADNLHVPIMRVPEMIDSALTGAESAQSESVIARRALENTRIDRLQVVHWPAALRGDQKAFDNMLRLHDRRVRMNGLAVPTQVNLNVGIRAEMEAALSELEGVLHGVVQGEIVADDDTDAGDLDERLEG